MLFGSGSGGDSPADEQEALDAIAGERWRQRKTAPCGSAAFHRSRTAPADTTKSATSPSMEDVGVRALMSFQELRVSKTVVDGG